MARAVCLLLLTACALLAAGCGGSDSEDSPLPSSELVDLSDMDQLKTAFNDAPGVPRLILLLSPT